MKNKYIEALNKGSEIIIISANEDENSTIFYKHLNKYHAFTRLLGEFCHESMTDDKFIEHIERMKAENAQIFIRGCEE